MIKTLKDIAASLIDIAYEMKQIRKILERDFAFCWKDELDKERAERIKYDKALRAQLNQNALQNQLASGQAEILDPYSRTPRGVF